MKHAEKKEQPKAPKAKAGVQELVKKHVEARQEQLKRPYPSLKGKK